MGLLSLFSDHIQLLSIFRFLRFMMYISIYLQLIHNESHIILLNYARINYYILTVIAKDLHNFLLII